MTQTKTYEEILAAMQEKYRALTGMDADAASDIGIRLRVLAGQVHELYTGVDELRREMFPQTATGEALENHAACRGLSRKAALAATGLLRFSREIPAGADIAIPVGTICATNSEPQVRFETTAARTLPAGRTAVDVPARALDTGAQGNVGVGAACLMVSAAPGITGVTNPNAFTGGMDAEEDEALRRRLLRAFCEISNGANAAFYYDIAMQYDKVLSAQVIPRARGRGTVDVAVYCRKAADTNATLPLLIEEFDRRREVGVDVYVYSALRHELDIRAEVAAKEGYAAEEVESACLDALRDYMSGMQVGQPLLQAHMIRCLLAVDGVDNARITAPAADLAAKAGGVYTYRSLNVKRLSL